MVYNIGNRNTGLEVAMAAVISLINHRNISTLIHMKLFNPDTLHIFHSGNQEDRQDLEDLKEFMNLSYPQVRIFAHRVDMYDCEKLGKVTRSILTRDPDLMFDLSNGNPVAAMLLRQIAANLKLKVFVFSERDDRAALIKNGNCSEVDLQSVDLEIADFIKSGGGDVFSSSTSIYESPEIEKLLMWQIQNYSTWTRISKLLRSRNIIQGSGNGSQDHVVGIDLRGLSAGEKKLMIEFVYFLHESRIAKMRRKGKEGFSLDFRKPGFKQLLMVYGSWLEAITYHALKHLHLMDDLRSGVVFYWDERIRKVANEIDVMAVYRGRLVAVSCKDTSKYNEKDLNELLVAANGLGGENSIKILVSTQWPDKSLVKERAKEIGIHLVRFDGDLSSFLQQLKKIFD